MPSRVLLVEPVDSARAALQRRLATYAHVDTCTNFAAARERLQNGRYDWLITNLRLQSHNGLHLVYLAPRPTVSLVYTEQWDVELARDVEAAGAFYVCCDRLHETLPTYIKGTPPCAEPQSSNADAAPAPKKDTSISKEDPSI
jgi:DNA-binding NtrC family response regulator